MYTKNTGHRIRRKFLHEHPAPEHTPHLPPPQIKTTTTVTPGVYSSGFSIRGFFHLAELFLGLPTHVHVEEDSTNDQHAPQTLVGKPLPASVSGCGVRGESVSESAQCPGVGEGERERESPRETAGAIPKGKTQR